MKLSFSLSASPDFVFQHLSDHKLYTEVHPVIEKMEPIGDNVYKVYEKTKIGFIPYAFQYTAHVIPDKDANTVRMTAVIQKGRQIRLFFAIRPGKNGSVVEEEVLVEGMGLLKPILERFIRTQHNIMFSNIDKRVKA